MKSLILAFIFFGLLVWGAHDVAPFRAVRRVLRRTPKARPEPARPARVQAPPAYEPPARRHPY